ncbi:Ig-like domain-containing protein [Leptospira alstonii]|uniref:Ig-like domain-containing protein n=1 Tax=Leptospira alstonii TaxID=28452 RepID=UPI0007748EFA|nr:Ig-like domain-containing protein [Leptospira alstonii]
MNSYVKILISFSILIFGSIGCVQGKSNSMPFFAYLDFSNHNTASSFSVSQISPGPNVTGVSLNTSIQVGFSQKLDSSSIQSQSIQLTQGNAVIPGTITSDEKTILFNPTSSLAASKVYTVRVSKDIKSAEGSSLSEETVWNFTTATIVDLIPPALSLRTPTVGATLVPNNTSVQVSFTETMDCTSIDNTILTLKNNVTNIQEPANVVCLGSVATLTPTNPLGLAFNTVYRVDLLSTAKDLANNPLPNAYNWTFTTGPAPDLVAPTVSFVSPAPNAQNVAMNSAVSIAFSEPINCATIPGSIVLDDNPLLPGTIAGNPGCTGTTATFTPLAALAPNTVYTLTISGAITDLFNNPLAPAPYTSTFTTGPALDLTPPTVTFTVPSANAIGVGVNINPTVVFSEPMACASVNNASFRVKLQAAPPGVYLVGSVNCFGTSATWIPDPLLNPTLAFNTLYTVEVNAGALDAANNPIVPITWNFTTGPGPDVTPPNVAFVTPANAALGVAVNAGVSIAFNETMNCGTVLGGITLDDDPATPATVVGININCNGNTVSFAPTAPPLAFNTTYTVKIANTVTDSNNNAIGAYSWSFTTGAAPDVTPPQVSLVNPLAAATGVPTNANITVSFNETIDCSTLNFTVNNGIGGTVNCSGASATFVPNVGTPLNAGTAYTATIVAVKDLQGNSMTALPPAFSWNFTTGLAPDVIPPTVTIQNARNNTVIESGFVIGTAADDRSVASVEISIDGGAFTNAGVIGTTSWKYQLPTGAATWKQNSVHTIAARVKDSANNITTTATVSVRKGTNKDINGDGYTDIVSAEYGQGLVYIFHSSGTAGMTITTAPSASKMIIGSAGEEFGRSVSMGDLNGDGFADVVVGAPGWNAAQGRVYVFHSSGNNGVNISFPGFASTTISSVDAASRFGDSLATGDFNGDGFADLAAGEPVFNGSRGRVYVFHSAGAAGVVQTNVGAANVTLTGENANDRFGYSLSVGSMNGDNFSDLAVGAPGYGAGVGGGFVLNQGRAYVYHGSGAGLGAVVTMLTNNSAGNAGEFGLTLAAADFNGDGNSDLAIGSPGLNGGFGSISIFVSGGGAGINTDNIGNAPLIIVGGAGGNAFGISMIAQDLNLDGRADLVSTTILLPNRVFVFHMPGAGLINGFLTTGNATTQITSVANGLGVSANAPRTPISGGDVNGDGFPDLFIGGQTDNIYVFHSSAAGLLTNTAATAAGTIAGSGLANAFFGCSVY